MCQNVPILDKDESKKGKTDFGTREMALRSSQCTA